jgi:glycosyltransferase involved in cell wall biosynthesis
MTPEQQSEARAAGVDVYESRYKLEWMEDPWEDVDAAGDWLLDLEERLRPDLVHLNNYAHGDLSWRAPVVMVGHSCVYSWWKAVHGVEPPPHWSEYRRRVRSGLRAADMVVGVSRAMLRELQRWYGLASGAVVYNGHRRGAYAPAHAKEPSVLSTGRLWDGAKNMSTLDTAAGGIKWPVYVAGEAQHPDGGRCSYRNLQAIGRLSSQDLRPWFARCGIYALPALYEPFGLSVLEAALSGCALVLGDIPSLREIWGEAAVFVPCTDHEGLAVCVNSLIARPNVREGFGKRARARALSFTAERMAEGYLGVYAQTRARHGGKGVGSSCVS